MFFHGNFLEDYIYFRDHLIIVCLEFLLSLEIWSSLNSSDFFLRALCFYSASALKNADGDEFMHNLRIVRLVVCMVFLFVLVLSPFAKADWSTFRSDPSRSGLGAGNLSLPPVLLWSHNTGGEVYSSPIMVTDVVYVASDDGNVYALNAAKGIQLWNFSIGDFVTTSSACAFESSPAVVGGVVYIGSFDGNVYALNATSGASIWNYKTGGEVESSPAVVGGVVYVASDDGNVYALNAAKGIQLWNFSIGDFVTTSSACAFESSPAVVGGVVYIGSFDGNVYALNATSGANWNYKTGGEVESSPAVVGGVVYIGSFDGNVYALNATSGASIWRL